MESSLQRVLDFKLVFDALADSKGRVQLEALTCDWPSDIAAPAQLPRGCSKYWRQYASDGWLDWERFSAGVAKALREDRLRLSRSEGAKRRASEAEMRLASLQGREAGPREVRASEIEEFLLHLGREALVQALVRTRKEVYSAQRSLHTLASPSPARRASVQRWQSVGATDRKAPLHATTHPKMSPVREREELCRGLEMAEQAQRVFSERLQQLEVEASETGHLEEMEAASLLAVLENGETSSTLQHINDITTHLKALDLGSHDDEEDHTISQHPLTQSLSVKEQRSSYGLPSAATLPTDHPRPKRSLSHSGSLAASSSGNSYPLRETYSMRELPQSLSWQQGDIHHPLREAVSMNLSTSPLLAVAPPSSYPRHHPSHPHQHPSHPHQQHPSHPHQQHPSHPHQHFHQHPSHPHQHPSHPRHHPSHPHYHPSHLHPLPSSEDPLSATYPPPRQPVPVRGHDMPHTNQGRKYSSKRKSYKAQTHRLEKERASRVREAFEQRALQSNADDSILSIL